MIMRVSLIALDSNSYFSWKETYSNHLVDMPEHMLASSTRSLRSGRALRVIPRGKQRLTVYRAHQFDHKNKEIDVIHEKESFRSNFSEYISSRAIQKCIRCFDSIVLESIFCAEHFFVWLPKFEIVMKIWHFSIIPRMLPGSF